MTIEDSVCGFEELSLSKFTSGLINVVVWGLIVICFPEDNLVVVFVLNHISGILYFVQ